MNNKIEDRSKAHVSCIALTIEIIILITKKKISQKNFLLLKYENKLYRKMYMPLKYFIITKKICNFQNSHWTIGKKIMHQFPSKINVAEILTQATPIKMSFMAQSIFEDAMKYRSTSKITCSLIISKIHTTLNNSHCYAKIES